MKASRYISFFLLLFPIAAAAQVNDTYVIPAAGNAPGAFGTYWKTQFSVFNPHLDYPLKISVTFIPTGGAQGTEVLIDVPANALWFSDDAMVDLFNMTNVTGSLLLATFPADNPTVPNTVIARSFLVTTNTYTEDPNTHGIYGQTIPGSFGTFVQQSDGITAIAHGIRDDDSQSWRTNVGALNLGRSSVTLLVSVYDANGNTVASNLEFKIPPMAQIQDRLPVTVNPGSIEFSLTGDAYANDPANSAVVFPYVSVVDDISGDPSYQAPVLLASATTVFKTGAATALSDRKITTAIARRVRDGAIHLGEVQMKTRYNARPWPAR